MKIFWVVFFRTKKFHEILIRALKSRATLCETLWLNLLLLPLIVLIFFCSCVKRDVAPDVALKAQSERIVSLVPAVTEILFAIGAGDKVVGVTEYCDYPPEAKSRTSVGGFSGATVSVDQIHLLEPDLVLLSADMHERIVAILNELGIPTFTVEPRNFSQVYRTIAVIGELTGCIAGAEKVISEMKNKIEVVEECVEGMERPAVFWILSENPLMSAGAETFISEAIWLAGGRNIFAELKEQWPMVSPEQVLLRKPDWILIGDDIGKTAAFLAANPLWQNIPAVREGRVAVIDSGLFYRYGPRLSDGVECIARILHP